MVTPAVMKQSSGNGDQEVARAEWLLEKLAAGASSPQRNLALAWGMSSAVVLEPCLQPPCLQSEDHDCEVVAGGGWERRRIKRRG